MAVSSPPAVYVSSTCYDLAQVRQNIREFLESIGVLPVLSEYNSFPIDPNAGAVENCLAGVKNYADIFVLIVGGRYGSITSSGRSVTNLEYIEAKAKGIPRYVFVQKSILTALPIWKKNQSGDFSEVVDSPKLFEFVESLRDPKENWVFDFESAHDITGTLRKQFAYLFRDSLDYRHRVLRAGLANEIHELSGPALQIAVTKPWAWEYRLFSQIVHDEIAQCADLKMNLEYGQIIGRVARLRDKNSVIDWMLARMAEIGSLSGSAVNIINVAAPKAYGAPGEPGNAEKIMYCGKQLGKVYRRILEWTLDFRHVSAPDDYDRAFELTSHMSSNMIREIEELSATLHKKLSDAADRYEQTKERQEINIQMSLTVPDITDLLQELDRIKMLP